MIDTVQLTQELVRFDTTNPPGREAQCGTMLADLLATHGFQVRLDRFDTDRMNIVALRPGMDGAERALVLTGHIDTVPLGSSPWSKDPFGAIVESDRIYGRGVSDMKAGIAAIVGAAARCSEIEIRRGIALVLIVAVA